jgi:hypothetical protein
MLLVHNNLHTNSHTYITIRHINKNNLTEDTIKVQHSKQTSLTRARQSWQTLTIHWIQQIRWMKKSEWKRTIVLYTDNTPMYANMHSSLLHDMIVQHCFDRIYASAGHNNSIAVHDAKCTRKYVMHLAIENRSNILGILCLCLRW